MARLPTTLQPPPAPHSVVLAELAIAAGIAGHSITLYYQGYPAPLSCADNGKVVNADGYHRRSAVYSCDEDAVIPCKIV